MQKLFFLFLLIPYTVRGQEIILNEGRPASKHYYEEISYEWVQEKIIIPIKIEGKTYRFLLDTGAPNIISREIQEMIDPRISRSVRVSDSNDKKEKLDLVSIDQLMIGEVTFENTPSLVYDLKTNPIFSCFEIDGFIGSNMLRNSILQIDSKRKIIIITDSKRNLDLKKEESTKLTLTGNQSNPYIWVKLHGKKSGRERLLIDTGASGLYDISKKNYEVFKYEEIFKIIGESSGSASIGIFGDVPEEVHYKLLLPELEINNTRINDVVTITTNDNNSRIGSEILDYGIITIDYNHKKFYFSPFENEINALKPEFGYSKTFNQGKLMVGLVWDKDLKAQMKYGDQIVSINGVNINSTTLCELVTGKISEDDSVTLLIKNKENVSKEVVLTKKLPLVE